MSDSTDDLTFEMDQSKTILHKFQQYLGDWPVPLLVMTALGLRLYHLEQESLWLDEIGQVLVAKSSWWLTILRSAQHHGNTPLDYLVTHLALYVGQSEGILRLPAVIWGVLSIIIVYWLGQEMFDKPTGYLAAFLLSITPLHVYYSREVRFYSLATFLTLLSMYTFRRAIDRNTRWSWVLYGMVHFLALYAHYYVLIVTAIQGVWLLWAVYNRRYTGSTFIAFASTAGLALLLFLPWSYYDIHYEAVHKYGFLNAPFVFRFPTPIRLLGSSFFLGETPLSLSEPSAYWTCIIWGTMLVGGVVLPLRQRYRSHFISRMMLLMLFPLIGIPSILISDYLASYFFAPRQFLLYTPMVLLVGSVGYLNISRFVCSRLTENLNGEAVDKLAVVLAMLVSLCALWQPLTSVYGKHKADWRGTARYLMQHLRSDDMLVTASSHISFYAPELTSQIEELNRDDVPVLLQTAESYSRVWILGAGGLKRRYPDVYQWLQEEDPIQVFVDPQLRLYVYSVSIPPSQLLADLVRSRAYTPSTLLRSDFVERIIHEGYFEDSLKMLDQILADKELEIAEREQFAVRVGRELSDYGEHDKAIDALFQAISLDPANSSAWTNLGLIYKRKGEENDAISAYRKALALDPDGYWPNHLLASILYKQGQWRDVVSLGKRAVQAAPSDGQSVESLILMANGYYHLGNTSSACEVLRQAYAMQESEEVLDEITTLGCTGEP